MYWHKNTPKRIREPWKIYYIVGKTYKNYPYFKDTDFCELFVEELKLCKKLKKFELFAFSIMYDHVNLLLRVNDEFDISQVMKSLDNNFSRDVNRIIKSRPLNINDTLADRNRIRSMIQKMQERKYDMPKFRWQKSFFDAIIRINDKYSFKNRYNYTIKNHLKHNLPADWRFISTHYPELIDKYSV